MSPDPVSALFPSSSMKATQSVASLLGGAGGDFTSVFEGLLSSSRSHGLSTADPRLALVTAQSKLQQQTTLFNIFSDRYSTKSFGFGMLNGLSGLTSLPPWAYDVQRVMGDSQIDGLLGMQRQMAYLTASKMNGTSSASGMFSSLI